jgi:filamentous hemagglutinin family protein
MNTKYLFSSLTAIGIVSFSPITCAQTNPLSTRIPVADSSQIGTQVLQTTSNNFTITGGVNLGQNLLHSFTDFSVPTGGAATFDNSLGKQSIITRVTGGNFSDIDGLVNTQGANFFLLNPNGIVFGTNAQLNVGQTFVGSTANGIELVDGGGNTFNFLANQSRDGQLLTINPNALFNVSRLNMGATLPNGQGIVNYGTIAPNNDNQYVGLIGGNVTLDGQYGGGKIIALGGRVDVGGLNSVGTITTNDKGLLFGGNDLIRGDVTIINTAGISVLANKKIDVSSTTLAPQSYIGSNINISANDLQINNNSGFFGGVNYSDGTPNLKIGDININTTGAVTINNGQIGNVILPGGVENAGDIKIVARSLSLNNGSTIQAPTGGKGNAGNIDIETTGDITLFGYINQSETPLGTSFLPSGISTTTYGEGNAGSILINTKGKLSLTNNSGILSAISAVALNPTLDFVNPVTINVARNSPGITIKAQELELINSGNISSSNYGQGNGGDINITTQGNINISNQSSISTTTFQPTLENGKGNAGDINITLSTGNLNIIGTTNSSVLQGTDTNALSSINSSTYGFGDAGKIKINANQGKISIANGGGIFSQITATAVGNSEGIKIETGELEISNFSNISTVTSQAVPVDGNGKAGDIDIITTGNLTIVGTNNPSNLQFTNANALSSINSGTYGQGDAGKITINTNQGKLSLASGAQISSSTNGKGNAGDLTVTAANVDIDGETPNTSLSRAGAPSGLIAEVAPTGTGKAGNLTLITGRLNVSNGGKVQAPTFGTGNGGNLFVKADEINVFNTLGVNSFFLTNINVGVGFNPFKNVDIAGNPVYATGNSGNLKIETNRLRLSRDVAITADSRSAGQGGNIDLNVKDYILMRQGSEISTTAGTAQQDGDGGNITITAPNGFIVTAPNENSDISANSFSGSGGKVTINTQQNFWISPLSRAELEKQLATDKPSLLNPFNLPTNNITAISQVNPTLNGQVTTTPPEIDPSRGLSPLPNNVTDPSNQIDPNCSAKAIGNNSFTNVGRGGIPATPKDPLNEQEIATNWVRINPQDTRPLPPNSTHPLRLNRLSKLKHGDESEMGISYWLPQLQEIYPAHLNHKRVVSIDNLR